MAKKRNDVVVWFEIPAADFDRAVGFYEKLMGYTLMRDKDMGMPMAAFTNDHQRVSGCVREKPGHKGMEGVMIYLNCNGFLNEAVARVEKAGGKLCSPIVELPGDMGRFIHIEDTEGNRVGLHAVV